MPLVILLILVLSVPSLRSHLLHSLILHSLILPSLFLPSLFLPPLVLGRRSAANAAEIQMSFVKPGIVLILATASTASADLVAGWTITTAFPTGAGNVPTGVTYTVGAADQGTNAAGSNLSSVHALAAATYTSPAGNGSQYAFSSNNWSIGDYYQASFSTLGFEDITVSWDQARSATGPASFELVMSVDGGATFSFVVGYTVLQSGGGGAPGTWSSTTYNALYTSSTTLDLNADSLVSDNQSSVILRFRSLVTAAAAGSSRIDNVMVNGNAIPTPGSIALLGLAGLVGRRRR